MKTYRAGVIRDVIGFLGWAIQEKKWYGWNTLKIYKDEKEWKSAVDRLKNNPNCIVL